MVELKESLPETNPAAPFLRWAGSKRQLVPVISQHWNPTYQRYIEPFMGSACVFFHIRPAYSILSDINPDLIRTFETVRARSPSVAAELHSLPRGKSAYYKIRSRAADKLTRVKSAARFIYLNRFCFNGLYRTNRAGTFNVPYASGRTGPLPTAVQLTSVAKLLRKASIQCADFEQVLGQVERDDFVYLDPPFAVQNRRIFRQYARNNFGVDDLARLAACLREVDARGATFVLSYAFCKEAIQHFGLWPHRRVYVNRNIAGFHKCRRRAVEMLFTNRPVTA